MIKFKVRRRGRGIREKLRLFISGKAQAIAANVTADTMLDLVHEGFARQTDPYGIPWDPRVDDLSHPILDETGLMKANFFALVIGADATIENTIEYSSFHQHGTSKMPARPIFPDGRLPPGWAARIDQNITIALKLA